MSFADDFRTAVMPRLKREIEARGFLLGLDLTDFGDGVAAIHETAHRFGSGFLPSAVYDDLGDWVTSGLLRESIKAEPRIDALIAEVEAAEIADPIKHYSDLAAASSDPDRFKWIFAAISPEYRAFLLAQKRRGDAS